MKKICKKCGGYNEEANRECVHCGWRDFFNGKGKERKEDTLNLVDGKENVGMGDSE